MHACWRSLNDTCCVVAAQKSAECVSHKILSWCVKVATESAVRSPLLLSKVCACCQQSPSPVLILLFIWQPTPSMATWGSQNSPLYSQQRSSSYRKWGSSMAASPSLNILPPFWMYVDMGSAYLRGLLGDFLKDAARVLFGKWSNPFQKLHRILRIAVHPQHLQEATQCQLQ